MKPLSVILIGCGMRGISYSTQMHQLEGKYQIVAIADPIEQQREKIRALYDIPDENCFDSWEQILAKPKMADICMICTSDHLHYAPAMKAIELGYNILLEKPVAPTEQECIDIANAAQAKGVKVLVCHVLRYTDFYGRIKQLLMDGAIGDVVSLIEVEAVGNLHQSHSFVRGNWHSEKESAPMLLAKCCHDVDIIQWLLDKRCKKVQSFGCLKHFCAENAPAGAPVRCIDGNCPVEESCIYSSRKLYYDNKKSDWFRGACAGHIAKGPKPTDEEVLEALRTTDYGLCVYHANNDVVDNQTVNMFFDGGITATLTMNAFNEGGRYIRIFGTKGELYANMGDTEITLYTFADKQRHSIPVSAADETILGGHGGGDAGIIRELHQYLDGNYQGFRAADINVSVENHRIVFAAERSRHTDTVQTIEPMF